MAHNRDLVLLWLMSHSCLQAECRAGLLKKYVIESRSSHVLTRPMLNMGTDEEHRGLLPLSGTSEKVSKESYPEISSRRHGTRPLKSRLRFWLPVVLATALCAAVWCYNRCNVQDHVSHVSQHSAGPAEPILNSQWTDEVAYDNYSLILRGQRIFLQCALFFLYLSYIPELLQLWRIPPMAPARTRPLARHPRESEGGR